MTAAPALAAPPPPVDPALAQRILDLAAALVVAVDSQAINARQLALALLVAAARQLPPQPVVELRTVVAQTLGRSAGYEVSVDDGAVIVRLHEGVHDAALRLDGAQLAQLTADLRAVQLAIAAGGAR